MYDHRYDARAIISKKLFHQLIQFAIYAFETVS